MTPEAMLWASIALIAALVSAFMLGRRTAPKPEPAHRPAIIDRISATQLHDGDILILESESYISQEQAKNLRDEFERAFSGKKVALVMGKGMRVAGVLQRDLPEAK